MSLSRYIFMNDGSTLDKKTNSYFPDPLSLDYGSFNMQQRPGKEILSDEKINYFWRTYMEKYNTRDFEDVVLTLNGVSHKNFLHEGDAYYYPDHEDIRKSFTKTGKN